MICGNARDFIDHPLPKDSVGPPTTLGLQAPHYLNPALKVTMAVLQLSLGSLGGVERGGASPHPKVLICRKSGQKWRLLFDFFSETFFGSNK